MGFIDGDSRDQISLLQACIDEYVAPDSLFRVVDAFVASLDLAELGFNRVVAAGHFEGSATRKSARAGNHVSRTPLKPRRS